MPNCATRDYSSKTLRKRRAPSREGQVSVHSRRTRLATISIGIATSHSKLVALPDLSIAANSFIFAFRNICEWCRSLLDRGQSISAESHETCAADRGHGRRTRLKLLQLTSMIASNLLKHAAGLAARFFRIHCCILIRITGLQRDRLHNVSTLRVTSSARKVLGRVILSREERWRRARNPRTIARILLCG